MFGYVARGRHTLLLQSAHDTPPALAAFAELGSYPFNVYKIIAYDKLNVFDLGLKRLFCDMTNDCLRHHSSLSLTKLIFAVNDRFVGIPPFARLPSYKPFKNSKYDSQSGLSGKMLRQTAPFLWFCLVSITDKPTDDDPIVPCALKLDGVN